MTWFKTKLDKADIAFSKYVRTLHGKCVYCGKKGEGKEGITGLQLSHYFSRRKESVRYDLENCDSLCIACHRKLGTDNRQLYDEFKIRQLGQKRFDALVLRANTTGKRERDLEAIYWRKKLKELATKDIVW